MADKTKRSLKVNLSAPASAKLKRMAQELGVSETEVLRKGLNLLAVYNDVTKKQGKVIVKQGDSDQQLIVI